MQQNYNEFISSSSFITTDFDEPVLYSPARVENAHPCNSLKIITAFTDCDRISTHMINLQEGIRNKIYPKDIKVDIILGMTKSSLSQKKHEDICRLIRFINQSKEMPRLTCRYIYNGTEVHSKVYIWGSPNERKIETPYCAYCGSLNYTTNAFYKRRECITLCDPSEAYAYYQKLLTDTIDCFDPQASEKVKNVINQTGFEAEEPDNSEKDYMIYNSKVPIDTLKISLLKSDGTDVGYGSGINWGIRQNGTKRNLNQAYIPYNKKDKKEGFFPDKLHVDDENYPIFKVITNDFGAFHMRLAQGGAKAIHSVESNAILGEWLRKRLGAPSGGFITKQMLELYGKTFVTFRKYEDGVYLLDF